MTDRLYDRRVAVYPGLFAATTPFRHSVLDSAADLDLHLRSALVAVDEWHSREGGLMLSPAAHARLLELRKAVRECLNRDTDATNLDDLKRNIWICKNNLRKAMRQDLLLMFDEDQ